MLKLITSIVLFAGACYADVGQKLPPHRLIKIAVIDTGIDPLLMKDKKKYSLCEDGHKSFAPNNLDDSHGHGTHISGIIDQYAKNVILGQSLSDDVDNIQLDYCQIIIKFFDSNPNKENTAEATLKSIRWAIDQNVDIINYSAGGESYSQTERDLVVEALNKGIKFVAAAGNNHHDINKVKYFPAMYDNRIYVVGNLESSSPRKVASTSNYGSNIENWEVGINVLSRLPNLQFGTMSGTSQATAIKSGKIVREMLLNSKSQLGTRVKLKK